MVKIEEYIDSDDSSEVEFLGTADLNVGSSGTKPCSSSVMTNERDLSRSSRGHLKSYFVGMGFSATLVEKVIDENGEGDTDSLLEILLTNSALQKQSPVASDSFDEFSNPDKQDDDSPFESTTNANEQIQELTEASVVGMDKRSYLLRMNFSEKEIDLAINQLGEFAPVEELVDFIVVDQSSGFSKEKNMCVNINGCNGKSQDTVPETLFGTMDKTLCLLQMGFSEDEVSAAIEDFGPEIPITELADSIFAKRIAYRVKEEGSAFSEQDLSNRKGSKLVDHTTAESSGCRGAKASADYEDIKNIKKVKHMAASFSNNQRKQPRLNVKEEIERTPNPRSKPTYFFYGNVVDIPHQMWQKLSQYLNATEPEFVNSQFFSAFIRKEGYLHNLPTKDRLHIFPKPPMTIEDALPNTRQWWPSWDTRKQLSCINPDTTGASPLCERLEKVMVDSKGLLSKEQQTDILHHCKRLNLLWVGHYKLSPIEPDQVERILGYPLDHTRVGDWEPSDRLKALKFCFQTDTLGYHLSVLKGLYPDGLNLLSVYTGIGGAELALHRLGIRLKCVVSVEASEVNRKILKRWWANSGQPGELVQIGGIEKLTMHMLEGYVVRFGGFDVIIGANPGTNGGPGTSIVDSSIGIDQNLFYEFARVYQRVKKL